MFEKRYRIDGWSLILFGILGGLLFGLLYDAIWAIVMVLIGILLILWGISYIVYFFEAKSYKKDKIVGSLIRGCVITGIGILIMIPWTNQVVQMIISTGIGLYILVQCLFRLKGSAQKKAQFMKDLFQYVLAIFIIVLGVKGGGYYLVMGFFLLVTIYGIVLVCVDYKYRKKVSSSPKQEEVIDAEYHVDDK